MSDATASALQKVINTALKQSGSTQAMVGIWAPWEGDFVQGITTDGSTLSLDTQFRAAQSSQAVVCAALLSLVNDGELELKRKVSKDLPRQVGIENITYGQLCEGTSGLADFKKGFEETFANNPTRLWPERELIAAGIVRSPLSDPGKTFHLSDTNALLLGKALSVVTQQPLSEILKERVFDEADMNNSSYPEPTLLKLRGQSLSGLTYPITQGELQCGNLTTTDAVSSSMLSGAGGTVSTLANLRDFYAKYVGGSFETESTKGLVQKALPFAVATEDTPASLESWGFGLRNIGPLWGNVGSITGTISAAFHDPISGYSVIVALNNSSAGAEFAKNLALKLTSVVADKAPGGLGDLTWSEADVTAALKEGAVCQ